MSFVRHYPVASLLAGLVAVIIVITCVTYLVNMGEERQPLTEAQIRKVIGAEIRAFDSTAGARTDSVMARMSRGERAEGAAGAQPWLDLVSALRREHSNIMRNQAEQRAIGLEIRGMVVRYLCWVSRGLDPACGTASAVPAMTHSTRPAP